MRIKFKLWKYEFYCRFRGTDVTLLITFRFLLVLVIFILNNFPLLTPPILIPL